MLSQLATRLVSSFWDSTTPETHTDYLSRFDAYRRFFRSDLASPEETLNEIDQMFEALGKQGAVGAIAFLRVLDEHLPTQTHLQALPRFQEVDVPQDHTGRSLLVIKEMLETGPVIVDQTEDDTAERNHRILRAELARLTALHSELKDTAALNAG